MSWVNDYSRATFQIYAGNTLESFQPLDFFHFYPMWYDVWIARIVKALDALKAEEKHYRELKHLLPVPSSMRAILQKIVPSYRAFRQKDIDDVRRVTLFFVRMLEEACPSDPFGLSSTPLHTPDDVQEWIATIPWRDGNPAMARQCGRLVATAGSLVHGLYNDLVTDFGWDAYGPYELGNETLLLRHFPDLQPEDLWPREFLGSVKELKLYGWYEGVDWKIACVGCHTLVNGGNPINGLLKYAVAADGNFLAEEAIGGLVQEFATKAEAIYRQIRSMDFEQLKEKVMLQECYQLKKIFDAAELDWRPSGEMTARIAAQPLLTGLLPRGVLMTDVESYKDIFGIRQFAKEVLGEDL